MALLNAAEIYVAARHAGFSPDQAVTMTAIALAESGGNTDAHNPNGEDSWGLWQINFAVHNGLERFGDRTNPLANARMAYEVSNEGADIGRWTVTHNDKGARYLTHRVEAERAAYAVEPQAGAQGSWNPPDDYYDTKVSAGDPTSGLPLPPLLPGLLGSGDEFLDVATSQLGYPAMETNANQAFLDSAIAQDGDTYVFGAETSMDDANPDTFDCSELVQWAAAQAGVELTDGSWLQYQHVQKGGGEMSVEQALQTPGALLFRFGSDPNGSGRPKGAHVAISLGDGRTIEARGSKYGVGFFDAKNRGWTHAGAIPELGTGAAVPRILPDSMTSAGALSQMGLQAPQEIQADGDTDGDGLLDRVEIAIGTDPFSADTDRDGFIDSVELLDYATDPLDHTSNARDITTGVPVADEPADSPIVVGAGEFNPVRIPEFRPSPTPRPSRVEPAKKKKKPETTEESVEESETDEGEGTSESSEASESESSEATDEQSDTDVSTEETEETSDEVGSAEDAVVVDDNEAQIGDGKPQSSEVQTLAVEEIEVEAELFSIESEDDFSVVEADLGVIDEIDVSDDFLDISFDPGFESDSLDSDFR